MPSGMLYRLSGIALLLGTLLTVLFSSISFILFGANQLSYLLATNGLTMLSPRLVGMVTGPLWLSVNLVILVGSMLLVAGLPGMYASLAKRAGWLGLLGFVLTMATVLLIGVIDQALLIFIWPLIAAGAPQMLLAGRTSIDLGAFYPVSRLLFSLGAFLLGLAILRAAGLLNRAKVTGVALIIAAVCNVVHLVPLPDGMWLFITIGSIAGVLSFLIGLAVFGYILVSLSGVQVVRHSQIATEEGSSVSTATLYRLSGLALLAGSVLASLLGFYRLHSLGNITLSVIASPYWVPAHLIALTAAMLILVGLPGMFICLVKPASWSGIVGFVLTFCAVLMLGVIDLGFYAFGIPLIGTITPQVFHDPVPPPAVSAFYLVAHLAFCVGAILFGRAILRAAVLPHEFDIIGMSLIFAGPLGAIAGTIDFVPIQKGSLWEFSNFASFFGFVAFFLAMSVCGRALMLCTEKAAPIIGRPLIYGMLTAGVVTSYVLVVGSLGVLLQQTRGALIISLIAIGLVAILVQPVRDRLQQAVNRLVYGERDNPYAVLSHLGKHMEATLAPESVLPTIVETIARSLKLPYAAIVLKQEDELTVAAAYGPPIEEQQRFPLVYQGEQLGELVLSPRSPGEPLTPADQHFLHNLTPQIGVAVNAVRLTVDVQRSRERLVTAREEERRRLRRDLHDGLGPQLASQTLTLTAARKLLRDDPEAAEALLADATVHVQEAITDIRRLVYDLRPPALDDLGLIAALREQIAQYHTSGISFILDVPEQLPVLAAAVEVACYRIIQEALTNVVRHAHARTCVICIVLDGVLTLEITDDGIGLTPSYRPGVGFSSMRERAEELGGSCIIESRPVSGTRVHAQLPLI